MICRVCSIKNTPQMPPPHPTNPAKNRKHHKLKVLLIVKVFGWCLGGVCGVMRWHNVQDLAWDPSVETWSGTTPKTTGLVVKRGSGMTGIDLKKHTYMVDWGVEA